MSNNHTRTLVTGASGVIGRQLTKKLLGRGLTVFALDREPMPPGEWSGLQFERGDLSRMSLNGIAEFAPTSVIHLAASFERSEESSQYWNVGWHDDVVASHRLIDAVCREATMDTFVFASSYLVYDPSLYLDESAPPEATRLAEEAPIGPRNLCGAGKFYTERELRYIVKTTRPDLRVVFARIFRVYGAGSRDVISRWIHAGVSGEPINVFNRSNRFDFVYAGDVADALLHLEADSRAEGAYNVGSGRAASIDGVLSYLVESRVLKSQDIVDLEDQPPYESSVADITRLRDQIGQTAKTSLRSGIDEVVRVAREVGRV